MAKLFGIDIAGLVAKNVGPGLLPTQVQFIVTTEVDTSNPLSSTKTSLGNPLSGRGVIVEYDDVEINGSTILQGDRKIVLIVGTFPANMPIPFEGCAITIEGSTHIILSKVSRDPAAATYTCQVRV